MGLADCLAPTSQWDSLCSLRTLGRAEGPGYSPASIKGLMNLTFLPFRGQECHQQVEGDILRQRDFAVFSQLHHSVSQQFGHMVPGGSPQYLAQRFPRTHRPQHIVIRMLRFIAMKGYRAKSAKGKVHVARSGETKHKLPKVCCQQNHIGHTPFLPRVVMTHVNCLLGRLSCFRSRVLVGVGRPSTLYPTHTEILDSQKESWHKSHYVYTNTLGTVSHPYQLGNGGSTSKLSCQLPAKGQAS